MLIHITLEGVVHRKAIKVIKAIKVFKAIKAIKVIKAIKAIKVFKVFKAIKVIKVIEAIKVFKAIKVVKAIKVIKVIKAIKEFKETKVTKAMQGPINMGTNKIENVADPVLANDPVTKQYANRVYLTHSGFTMQDNIGMNNHEVLGLNPNPSDGTSAVSKDFTDSQYVKKNADTDMNNNRILNLPFP